MSKHDQWWRQTLLYPEQLLVTAAASHVLGATGLMTQERYMYHYQLAMAPTRREGLGAQRCIGSQTLPSMRSTTVTKTDCDCTVSGSCSACYFVSSVKSILGLLFCLLLCLIRKINPVSFLCLVCVIIERQTTLLAKLMLLGYVDKNLDRC
jgi:hypothetical protein